MQQHLSQLRSFVPVQVHIHQEHVVIDKDSVVLPPTIVTVNTASNHTPPDIAAGRHMGGSGLVVAVPAMALLSASAWFGIMNSVALDGEIMEPTHTNVSHEDDSAEDTLWKFRTEAGKHVALSLRDVTYSSSSRSYSHRQPTNPRLLPRFWSCHWKKRFGGLVQNIHTFLDHFCPSNRASARDGISLQGAPGWGCSSIRRLFSVFLSVNMKLTSICQPICHCIYTRLCRLHGDDAETSAASYQDLQPSPCPENRQHYLPKCTPS